MAFKTKPKTKKKLLKVKGANAAIGAVQNKLAKRKGKAMPYGVKKKS